MNLILINRHLTDIHEYVNLQIDSLKGNVVKISSGAYLYNADFTVSEDGSYKYIEGSFEADPLGLSYKNMEKRKKKSQIHTR